MIRIIEDVIFIIVIAVMPEIIADKIELYDSLRTIISERQGNNDI